MNTPDIKVKIEQIPDGTAHRITQWIIWGDKDYFKEKFTLLNNNEQKYERKTFERRTI